MRIVGGERKGFALKMPRGGATRPTSDRARQALFDILIHAPWGGAGMVRDACILDAFAGTGALGIEALSRGARIAAFMENDRAARAALSANLRACSFTACDVSVLTCDVMRAPRASQSATLVFLDPPYGKELVPTARRALKRSGWIAPGTLVVAETGVKEEWPLDVPLLTERCFGAAVIRVWREPSASA